MTRGRMRSRGVISATVVVTLALSAGIVQWQSPAAQAAGALFAQTVADARAAALAIENHSIPEPDSDVVAIDTPTSEATADPVPVGTITPGEPSTVSAPEVGAKVDFSGHAVASGLEVAVTGLPAAAVSAATETSSVVLTQPFQVTATTRAGDEVTSFPADPTFENPNSIQPVLLDVTPGVELSITVTASQLAGIDPTTVRIVTRESESDPWVELPSFYDSASGAAVAQSDHLSTR